MGKEPGNEDGREGDETGRGESVCALYESPHTRRICSVTTEQMITDRVSKETPLPPPAARRRPLANRERLSAPSYWPTSALANAHQRAQAARLRAPSLSPTPPTGSCQPRPVQSAIQDYAIVCPVNATQQSIPQSTPAGPQATPSPQPTLAPLPSALHAVGDRRPKSPCTSSRIRKAFRARTCVMSSRCEVSDVSTSVRDCPLHGNCPRQGPISTPYSRIK